MIGFLILRIMLVSPISVHENISIWKGTVRLNETTWLVDLKIDPSSAPWRVWFGSPSLWRDRLAIAELNQTGSRLRFTVPSVKWLVSVEIRGRDLIGSVQFPDGGEGRLEASKTKPFEYKVEDRMFVHEAVKIATSTYLPEGTGPFPAVILLHGGGNSSRKNPGYAFYGHFLAKRGIACLLYDKRGNGKSTGDWRKATLAQRAGDVVRAVDLLHEFPTINRGRMGLIGVSQGSWVAGLVARMESRIAFVVNVSGPAVPVWRADTDAIAYNLWSRDASKAETVARLKLWELNLASLRKGDSPEAWKRLMDSVASHESDSWFQNNPYRPVKQSWWRGWYPLIMNHDPGPVLADLHIPMLWVFGEFDSQSSLSRNLEVLQQMKTREGKNYRIEIIPKTGHGIMGPIDAKGAPLGPLSASPEFFNHLVRFIKM